MLGKDAAERLSEICDEWNKAELAIKLAEQVSLDVVTPAIKELRYAGRRIVDALHGVLHDKPDVEITALVENAKFDCYRARHDAIDASLSTIALEVNLITKKLGYKAVLIAYPAIEEFIDKFDAAKTRVTATRQNRHQRDEVYQDLISIDLPELIKEYNKLKKSEAIMRKIAAKDRVAFWASVVLAVFGNGLAIYLWSYPPSPAPALIILDAKGVCHSGPSLKTIVSCPH